nr:putative retrotransposon Orf1 [Ipomoea batatas]
MPPKSRRKECAKKRKHDVGSSSRSAEGESDLLIPGGRSLKHLSGAQIARVEELRAKGVSGGFYFDYPMLDAYGCREEVERMMTRRSWEHLFSWRDDTYEPVVHEFIATYTSIPSNHMWTPCMKFTLFGREHQVSLIHLGEYLGFYTPEDTQTEKWRNLPTDFDSDAAAEAYWHQITNGQGGRFTGTKPNTSKIVRPPLLIMKLLLNLTFGGRNKNLHKIYRFDLFNLRSLEMNEPIQMACMMQQLFTSQTHPKCPYVWIGPMVTRLCHGLGLQRELTREKSIASMQPFTDAHLNRSYAPKIGAAPRPQQGEPPHEQEPVIQGGPDVPPEYAEYPPVYDWASMRAFQLQLHNQSMNAFNQRMDLHHEELMRQNEAIARQNEAILRQNEAYVRQEEGQEQQFQAIEQLRLWMEQRNLFSTPLSSNYGSPPPSPKGLPRAEMMVPRHTLERGEPSRMPNEDTSSEEAEAPNMEVAHRGLMIEVEDLFRQSYEESESIFVGPIVSRLCEALGFEDALAYEAVATTMTPLDIGDFLQFGIAPEEPSEDEARGEQRDLWGIIERLENRVNMLEQEVRSLTLKRYGEESDGSGI